MKYRQIGRSGLKVSVLTMGTFTFGGVDDFAKVGNQGVPEARRLIDLCIDAGITSTSTACTSGTAPRRWRKCSKPSRPSFNRARSD